MKVKGYGCVNQIQVSNIPSWRIKYSALGALSSSAWGGWGGGAMSETIQLSDLLKTCSRDSDSVPTVPITFQTQGITS